jgi:hypothetical protein
MVSKPSFEKTLLLLLVGIACHVKSTIAFTPISIAKGVSRASGSPSVLYSSDSESGEEAARASPEDEQVAAVPPSPPPVPQNRPMDPLMASLTRMDPSSAKVPTKNVPLFGEISVDGSLIVLVPAAVIAILGFVLSIVIAFQSQDSIVEPISQVAGDISQTATTKTNVVYDENVCRGLCSSRDQDLEGLRSFMESLRK